jgi:hypothetical protein
MSAEHQTGAHGVTHQACHFMNVELFHELAAVGLGANGRNLRNPGFLRQIGLQPSWNVHKQLSIQELKSCPLTPEKSIKLDINTVPSGTQPMLALPHAHRRPPNASAFTC